MGSGKGLGGGDESWRDANSHTVYTAYPPPGFKVVEDMGEHGKYLMLAKIDRC